MVSLGTFFCQQTIIKWIFFREVIRRCLEKYSGETFGIFQRELQAVKAIFKVKTKPPTNSMPKYAGQGMWARVLKLRLEKQVLQKKISSSDWTQPYLLLSFACERFIFWNPKSIICPYVTVPSWWDPDRGLVYQHVVFRKFQC